MLFYKLSGCRFEFSCSHVGLRYRVFIFLMLLTYVSSLNFTVDENNDEKSLEKFLIWFWDEIRTTFYYSSVIRQMGESQKGCFKKTNHAKFSKNKHILLSVYLCVSGGKKSLFFWKICRALFSWNTYFQIRPFALLPTYQCNPLEETYGCL